MSITLSEDQLLAFNTVIGRLTNEDYAGEVTTLTGPAGSGKTALMRTVIDYLQEQGFRVRLCTPTGKAAVRLSEVTGRSAKTMHKALYGAVWKKKYTPEELQKLREMGQKPQERLMFGDPHPPCEPGEIMIVDEASMVARKLYEDFQFWMPSESQTLYVGDKEQLPPVNDTWGPELDDATAQLTQVHRQAMGNPIIAYATAVREGWAARWEEENFNPDDPRFQAYGGLSVAIDWLVHQRQNGHDATLITYTHNIRKRMNEQVRRRLGLDHQVITPGDKLVIRDNNYALGLMNGEVVTVVDCDVTENWVDVLLEDDVEVVVKREFIEGNRGKFGDYKRGVGKNRKNLVHVHYGQCLTVHSSQGSQWDRVGFVEGSAFDRLRRQRPEEARRLRYTAVTRAAEQLAYIMSA